MKEERGGERGEEEKEKDDRGVGLYCFNNYQQWLQSTD